MSGWIDSGNVYGPGTKNRTSTNTASTSGSTTGTSSGQTMIASNGRTLRDTSGKASKETLASRATIDPNVEDVESSSDDYWSAYLALQEENARQQQAAIDAAVQQNVNTLNAQKDTTSQDYADAYRQLYLNNMKGQKNINQQMAAQGITGGLSESTLLGMNTNYEDNLRQGKVAEQNALSELDQAIANAKLSGSIESANAAATTGANTANAYLTAWQNQLAQEQANQQLQQSQQSEAKQYAYQQAMYMLQSGAMPSDALLNSAGISKADAQTIVATYTASANAKSGAKSGSSDGSNQTANATPQVGDIQYSDVLTMLQNGESKQVVSDAIALAKQYYNQNTQLSKTSKNQAISMLNQLQSRNNNR